MATTPGNDTAHRLVSEALEQGVRNRDWFLWINVNGDTFLAPNDNLDSLVQLTEQWLRELDPDAERKPAPFAWPGPHGVSVVLRALPKKPHARGSNPLVGNPYPAFAYWTGN
jgi:hypothetical protein